MEKKPNIVKTPKKTNYFLIGIVILLLLAIGFYFKTKQTDTTTNLFQTKKHNSIMDVLTGKTSMMCEVVDKKTGNKTIVYNKNGKMRIDSIIKDQNEKSQKPGHMINDTKYVYIWSDDSKHGIQMDAIQENDLENHDDVVEESNSKPKSLKEISKEWSNNPDVSYTCKKTSINDSIFVPPTGIQFTNISEMKNKFKNMQQNKTQQNTQESVQKSLQELREKLGDQ